MAIYRTPLTYVLVGVLMPGSVMLGARFIGQATPETIAESMSPDPSQNIPVIDIQLDNLDPRTDSSPSDHAQSPFWFEEIALEPFIEPATAQPQANPIVGDRIADIHVTSILPHPKNPLAIINSKPCRIGDELDGGWKLLSISGDARTVTLINKSGKKLTIGLTQKP